MCVSDCFQGRALEDPSGDCKWLTAYGAHLMIEFMWSSIYIVEAHASSHSEHSYFSFSLYGAHVPLQTRCPKAVFFLILWAVQWWFLWRLMCKVVLVGDRITMDRYWKEYSKRYCSSSLVVTALRFVVAAPRVRQELALPSPQPLGYQLAVVSLLSGLMLQKALARAEEEHTYHCDRETALRARVAELTVMLEARETVLDNLDVRLEILLEGTSREARL